MYALLLHFCRYLRWAALGAVLLVGTWFLMFDVPLSSVWVPGLIIVGVTGAIPLLLLRVGVGLAIRDPLAADRVTGMLVARIVLGGVLGWMAAGWYQRYAPFDLFHQRMYHRGWWLPAFVLAGAGAMGLTGWLFQRRYWRVLLPLSWAAVFALGVSGWFVLYKQASFKWPHLPPVRPSLFMPLVLQAKVGIPSPTPAVARAPAPSPLPSSERGPQAEPPARRRAAA